MIYINMDCCEENKCDHFFFVAITLSSEAVAHDMIWEKVGSLKTGWVDFNFAEDIADGGNN